MSIKTCFTQGGTPAEMAAAMTKQLGDNAPKLVLFFASSKVNLGALGTALEKAYPNADVMGCTTAGEIVTGQMLSGSVVAMALPQDVIADCNVQIISNVQEPDSVDRAVEGLEKHFRERSREWNHQKYIGLILIDGLTKAEERVMDRLGDLTNVHFVGGSAGDDLQFKETFIYAKGRPHRNAAVLALLKPSRPFGIVKTQSFKQTGKTFTITKADERERIVYELDNKPAAEVYAKAVGCSVKDAPTRFMRHPIGLVAGDDVYVRSPQQIRDGAIVFYCNIIEGSQVSLLEGTDIVGDTRAAMEKKAGEMGGKLTGVINFHCILRTLELQDRKKTGDYGKVFAQVPTVGFSTYGEQLTGHVNQTSTMVVFG
jgi:hypothetical protein